MRDLRVAVRRLLSTPGFTIVALLTIALSVGANTIVYSLVDAVLLKPLPFRDPDRLLEPWRASRGFQSPYLRRKLIDSWQGASDVIDAREQYELRVPTLLDGSDPQTIPTCAVTGGLMQMLGVPPLHGRLILPSDGVAGAPRVAVIGEQLWRSRFNADSAVIGRRIRLDDESYEIVGVMPSRFRFPGASRQVWLAANAAPVAPAGMPVQVLARLRPGVAVREAEERLTAAGRGAGALDGSDTIQLRVYGRDRTDPSTRTALYVLFAAVGLVLLIACANLGALMLVRGSARQREIAVAAALGAGKWQILAPLLAEVSLLVSVGAIAGTALAAASLRAVVDLTPSDILRFAPNQVTLSWRVLLFAVAISALVTLVVGVIPGMRTWCADTGDVIRHGTARAGPPRQRFRNILIAAELALSVVLLVGAGLLGRTLLTLTRIEPGFDTSHVLAATLIVPQRPSRPAAVLRETFSQVLDRLRSLPGIDAAEISGGIPPGGGFSYSNVIQTDDGRVLTDEVNYLAMTDVGPDYFRVLGLPLVEGRPFTAQEAQSRDVMVVSSRFARWVWPGQRAAGRRFRMDRHDPWYTVVGVAGDVLQLEYEHPNAGFAVYYPTEDRLPLIRMIVVRSSNPDAVRRDVRDVIRQVDPELPVATLESGNEAYASFLGPPRFYALLMGVFAAGATTLGLIGLYGVLAYAAALRTREFGVRLALGAGRRRILRMVIAQGGRLAAIGCVSGVALSLFATRALQSLLVGVTRLDAWTYISMVAGLAVMTVAACIVPAWRAASTDPAAVLRSE